jgi:hypothetical protein
VGKDNNSMATAIPVIATVFAAAAILIVSITFDGPSFGKLWPLIPVVLFSSLAFTALIKDAGDWWPGSIFIASTFLLWLLAKTEVMPFSKSWPFLILIAGVLIVVAVMISKKNRG